MKKSQIILSLFVLIILILLVLHPEQNITACLSAIQVWGTFVLPALFPFFFFTKLLTEFGLVARASTHISPITQKLYNAPGVSGYIYFMSILSGYPVGAKLVADMYEKNIISYGQACRTVAFTSTSGPLFIIGTVGIGMFKSPTIGLIILISHFIGALLNGLLYRKYELGKERHIPVSLQNAPSKNVLEDCMYNSIKSILIVGGYIAIFFTIITMLNNYHILAPVNYVLNLLTFNTLPSEVIVGVTNGIIELTKGCLNLSGSTADIRLLTILTTLLISFGGFSIHLQALTFLKKINIKLSFYLTQKITHTAIAVCIATILSFLFL